jgi:3-deoxy-manno-octulosonate cytidylyltransferase (CMP-KDO synthetase)
MKATVIIPARMASTRYPGKPLVNIVGVPMVVRTALRAAAATSVERVVVATDSSEIKSAVEVAGFEAVMTRSDWPSGTDRCREACEKLGIRAGIIVNVQGDEPFIEPEQIDAVVGLVADGAEVGTLAVRIPESDAANPNKVKVVLGVDGRALYFSRAQIPFPRTGAPQYLKHLGIYAFRTDVLHRVSSLAPSALELAESLEQLRWLENGITIQVGLTERETPAVDTPEDLARIEELLKIGALRI